MMTINSKLVKCMLIAGGALMTAGIGKAVYDNVAAAKAEEEAAVEEVAEVIEELFDPTAEIA